MRHYKFILEGNTVFDVIANSFRVASDTFDLAGLDPQQILSIEEH